MNPPILPTRGTEVHEETAALCMNLERMRVPFRSKTTPRIEFHYSS